MLATILMALAPAIQGLLGHPVPDWPAKPAEQWVQGGPLTLSELRGRVVLIRFFTGTECPYCRATAPALNALHDEFAASGLTVIGIYTPKPKPRPVAADEVRACVASYGFSFPVAIDADWGALRTLWLDRVPGAEYTSSSLLIDREGNLRHVHEGGTLAGKDYDAMRSAVIAALGDDGLKRPR